MIESMNLHYSFTNPATVHDEEALTALELAGRQGAKINEVIADQNALRTETEDHLRTQDETIAERMEEQDSAIAYEKNVEIPNKVKSEFKKNVDNGTFDTMIDQYAGNLESRVNNLLTNVPEGSTTMDAEVIDARVGADNKTYQNLGEAIREQLTVNSKTLKEIVEKKSVNLYDYKKQTPDTIEDVYLDGSIENTDFSGRYFATAYIPLDGGKIYTVGLVPALDSAVSGLVVPWYQASCGVCFYDASGIYISSTKDNTFTTPDNCKFIRFNVCLMAGVSLSNLNRYCMLVEGDTLPDEYSMYECYTVDEKLEELAEEVEKICDYVVINPVNLFDTSLQTSETISPHYYYYGVPYETTQFDSLYNCTAKFEIEPNTPYTIGIVPAIGGYSVPWGGASEGIFFYDENENFIVSSKVGSFYTPVNAKYARFNYYIGGGITLDRINASCMLVKGETLPSQYQAYGQTGIMNLNIGFQYTVSGNNVSVVAPYDDSHNINVVLECKGGNNIFDFSRVSLISANSEVVELIPSSGDWHCPFIMRAVNNGNGDNPTSTFFTGGNHCYNNTGSGASATGRTVSVKVYADGKRVSGSGSAFRLRIEWTNMVQGYNTTKEDGSGREILQENHVLTFDGEKWESYTELLPLEDLIMETCYGLQCFGQNTVYVKHRYVGGATREVGSGLSGSKSGNAKTQELISYGDDHKLIMGVDTSYDIGDRQFYEGDMGIFVTDYGKAYCYLIDHETLYKDMMYAYKGYYQFKPV